MRIRRARLDPRPLFEIGLHQRPINWTSYRVPPTIPMHGSQSPRPLNQRLIGVSGEHQPTHLLATFHPADGTTHLPAKPPTVGTLLLIIRQGESRVFPLPRLPMLDVRSLQHRMAGISPHQLRAAGMKVTRRLRHPPSPEGKLLKTSGRRATCPTSILLRHRTRQHRRRRRSMQALAGDHGSLATRLVSRGMTDGEMLPQAQLSRVGPLEVVGIQILGADLPRLPARLLDLVADLDRHPGPDHRVDPHHPEPLIPGEKLVVTTM
jgi:hypothetical protein